MQYEKYSKILKALAHPLRLKMVDLLLNDECCVTDVTNVLGVPQSTTSQHLNVLKNSGVVYPKKYGTKTCYVVNDEVTKEIIAILRKKRA